MIISQLVTPPEAEPVTLAELKAQLRVDHGDEDAIIEAKISAARRHVEDLTGRTLALATYEFFLDGFPAAEIEVPRSPLVSVDSVNFVAPNGSEVTVSPSEYEVDTASPTGWIVPHAGFSWPETMKRINAVRIRFVAGYAPDDVPGSLKEAILQLAAWWYEQRETATVDGSPRETPFGVTAIINEHREWTSF